VDGSPYREWKAKSLPRPEKIVIIASVKRRNGEDAIVELPAQVHVVDGDDMDWGDETPEFVAIRNSPWDNDTLDGPFDVAGFLLNATFRASDDSESDSWDTQRDFFEQLVQREVDGYFRGPRAALMGILRNSLSWEVRHYAKQLGVSEIHFKRQGDEHNSWKVELILPDEPPAVTAPNVEN